MAQYPVVSLPTDIRDTLTDCCKLLNHITQRTVTPKLVRQALKQCPIGLGQADLESLLEYVLSDIDSRNCKELNGLKLLPLATNVFETIPFHCNSLDSVYILQHHEVEMLNILPGIKRNFLCTTLNQQNYQKMVQIAQSSQLQLRMLTPPIVVQQLLPKSLATWSSYSIHVQQPINWRPGYGKNPPSEWIMMLWNWLCKQKPNLIAQVIGLPILPLQNIDSYSSAVTLLPFAKSKYYVQGAGGSEEITQLFGKLGATVVSANEFVFRHPHIASYIVATSIESLVTFLSSSSHASTLSPLNKDEKAFLRKSIARYYYYYGYSVPNVNILKRLPIYEIGVGGMRPSALVSLQSPSYILPSPHIEFNDTLEYPANILSNKEPEVVSLMSRLGLQQKSLDELCVHFIIPFAIEQCSRSSTWCNGDELILEILKDLGKLQQSRASLASRAFVRTIAGLKCPNELYNTDDDIFMQLFDASHDAVFPIAIYKEKSVLPQLLSLGIITWANMKKNKAHLTFS